MFYIKCTHCNRELVVSDRDVGIICRYCGKYNSDVMERRFEYVTINDININFSNDVPKAPHIPNTKFVKYRDSMEKHAYEWAEKHAGGKRKFGPINPDTGERTR